MRRSLVAAVFLAIALSASGTASAAAPSGVRGIVTRGPVQPVCREGTPCDAPYPGAVLVFSRAGVAVKRATAGAGGRYSVRLAPGRYVVRLVRKPGPGGMAPRSFNVVPGAMTRLDLSLDTGIR